jgi:MoaD family protein
MMQVKLYGLIRQAAGVKMIEVETDPGLTIRAVLEELTQRYPAVVKYIWKEPGVISELAHVFVNSENIRHLAVLDTILKPEDRVDIFPPVVGG